MAIILIPLFLFPVLAFALPGLVASEMAELDQYVLDVEIQGSEYPQEWLVEFNNSSINLSYAPLPDVDFLSNSSNTLEKFFFNINFLFFSGLGQITLCFILLFLLSNCHLFTFDIKGLTPFRGTTQKLIYCNILISTVIDFTY